MTDKIQDRLREGAPLMNVSDADTADALALDWWENVTGPEAADYIDKLEAVVEKVAGAHFDLSLHKQHATLTYLKKVAASALAKLKEKV